MTKAVALEASIADSALYDSSSCEPLAMMPIVVNKIFQSSNGKTPTCRYCGRTHSRGKQHCPAAEAQCSYCHRTGHFAAVCLQKKKRPVARSVEEQTPVLWRGDELNVVYDTAYTVQPTVYSRVFTVTLMVNGKKCQGLLETGATRTLLTEDMVSDTRSSSNTLKAYGGKSKIETLGVADVTILAGDKSCNCTCFVVPVGSKVLFG
ncbi:uncharacterized protein LOC134189816 [Corticium candelabrum]|uniref:uncharacterized protein LOC134189816 n=1 Tax=Corticium candelabrum TaxID=121492 RepID=UPI002E253A96|nr:uncharacterized protein LOC134189816 [Corticium candelabrum]